MYRYNLGLDKLAYLNHILTRFFQNKDHFRRGKRNFNYRQFEIGIRNSSCRNHVENSNQSKETSLNILFSLRHSWASQKRRILGYYSKILKGNLSNHILGNRHTFSHCCLDHNHKYLQVLKYI
jgi:hypothetical protein